LDEPSRKARFFLLWAYILQVRTLGLSLLPKAGRS